MNHNYQVSVLLLILQTAVTRSDMKYFNAQVSFTAPWGLSSHPCYGLTALSSVGAALPCTAGEDQAVFP